MTTVNNELDINTLNWVKSEIDETMKQARTSLEYYIEDQDDESQLLFCINYLHQVYGTLQMVELYGASLLAEELELLANAIHDNKVKNKNEAFEVLIRGCMQLPDYLEKLQSGQKDTPIVLLPLFNDMRAARSEALLSETALFNPDLEIEVPAIEKQADGGIIKPIVELAKEKRHQFHLGLLGWFRNKNEDKSLSAISSVLQDLRNAAEEQNTSRMLWVADGLIDSLKDSGIETSIAVKSLVGQVDRNIKQIIDNGEVALAIEPPNELLKNLLYYVASSSAKGKKTKEIKDNFNLAEVMPDTKSLEKARADLNAPNMELMDTVSSVLKEDLQQVKDSLDIYMRSDDKNSEILVPVSEKLTSMADTLGMLSLGVQRKKLLSQVSVIDNLIDGSQEVNDSELMSIASTIIEIEQTLDSMSDATVNLDQPVDSRESQTRRKQPKSVDERKLLESVVAEAKIDIGAVKESVSEFSRQLNHPEVLNAVPALLDKVRGSLNMLQLDRAAELMNNCKGYVENDLMLSKTIPETETLDYLADAISSIEYYMESLVDSWGEPSAILNVATSSLEKLREKLDSEKPTVRDPSASQDAIHVDPNVILDVSDDTVINLDMPVVDESKIDVDDSEMLEGLDTTISDLEQPEFEESETVVDLEQPILDDDNSISAEPITLQNIEQPDFDLGFDSNLELEEQVDSEIDSDSLDLEIPATEETLELDLAADDSEPASVAIERLDESLSLWFMDPTSSDVTSLILEVIHNVEASISEADITDDDKENVSRITSDMKQTIQCIANNEDEFSAETEKVLLWARDALVKCFDKKNDADVNDSAGNFTEAEEELDDAKLEVSTPVNTNEVQQNHDFSSAPIEIDEEIFEIFLEEAEEEYENISKNLPVWKSNLEDIETLKDIRRSFHTLKGSGRLVGANDLGEFAWAFESMFNRVIDKTIVATPELLELADRGLQALPLLYDLLKSGNHPDKQIFSLMEHADSISRGESFTPLTETISSVSIAQPDLSELDLASNNSNAMEVHIDDSIDKIERPEIDSVLLEIYRKEVATHLAELWQFIKEWHAEDKHDVTEPLYRALHTLTGSARTTGVSVVSNLCLQLELYIKFLQAEELLVSNDGIALFEDSANRIEAICSQLGDSNDKLYSTDDLVTRAKELLHSLEAIVANRGANDVEESIELNPSSSSIQLELDDEYDEELLEIFIEEGTEILDESDHTLHAWIKEPDNKEHLEALQRQLHTLKGGARMSGVSAIGDLSHRVESVITDIVDRSFTPDDKIFNVLQQAQDSLVEMLEQLKTKKPLSSAQTVIEKIDSVVFHRANDTVGEDDGLDLTLDEAQQEDDLSKSDIPVVNDISEFDIPEIGESIVSVSDIESEESNDLSVEINPDTGTEDTVSTDEIEVNDLSIELTEELSSLAEDLDVLAVVDDVKSGNDSVKEIDDNDEADNKPQQNDLSVVEKETELPVFEAEDDVPQKIAPTEQVRVRADTLDNLVNFAGEVSIYRSRLEQQVNSFRFNLQELDETVDRFRGQLRTFEIETEAQIQTRKEETFSAEHEHFDPLEFDRFTQMQQISRSMLESMNDIDSLRSILSSLNRESETLLVQQSRVNTELQEGLMSTRLVPFDKQVNRLKRIVRQTCNEIGKQATIEFDGAELELDRAIVDRMMPPIEHMIRNAIAHGIEMPDARQSAGKSEVGNLHLSMSREGSDVIIQITDDGAGIDFDAIRNKAIEKGLIKEDSDLPENILLDMILESGFSTVDEITQIAGRGVGMDVVNNEIKQLGGVLNIDTTKGKGTTFTVSMPLSLAVSRALMVYIGESMYAVPLLSVEGVDRVSHEKLVELQAQRHSSLKWIDEDFRYIHLGNLLDGTTPSLPGEGNKAALLMVRSGNFRAAIHIEGLVGSREIVIKPVGQQISSLRGISGATIMGDGSVSLVLDLGVLIRLALTTNTELDYLDTDENIVQSEPEIEIEIEDEKNPVVMVVDDSITVRKVTSRFLERNALDIIQAKDGIDALTQLLDVIPDVMLLDVEMPRMDGFELAINMRNDERLKDIPIIMITSRTGQKHRDRAMNIGVNMYMGKPYNETELLDNIHSLLESNQ